MKTSLRWMAVLALWWGIGGWPDGASAQVISVSVGNEVPVRDPIGRIMPGRNGFPDSSPLVEIRQATQWGIIVAPDPETGEGSPANPLMANSYLGKNSILPDSGLFGEIFTNRLSADAKFYARVFDRPTPGQSIYYADSGLFEGSSNNVAYITVEFGGWKLRSTGAADMDTDGDGIPDAMESDLGLNEGDPDTDNDGWDDLFELLHPDYLQATEPNPIELEVEFAEYDLDTEELVSPTVAGWWTIPNIPYRLVFTEDMRDPAWTNMVWNGVASDGRLEVDIQDWMDAAFRRGFFRVVATPPDPRNDD